MIMLGALLSSYFSNYPMLNFYIYGLASYFLTSLFLWLRFLLTWKLCIPKWYEGRTGFSAQNLKSSFLTITLRIKPLPSKIPSYENTFKSVWFMIHHCGISYIGMAFGSWENNGMQTKREAQPFVNSSMVLWRLVQKEGEDNILCLVWIS